MSRTYYYDNNKPIDVTKETLEITPHTFLPNGTLWEVKSLAQFFNCIENKNYNIIDIGAQSGLYTLYAKYLPNTTFYSFEPFYNTYKILNDNIKLNNINNVNTYNLGLSDISGYTILNTSISHNGLHTMGKNPLRFTDIKPIKIQVETIDNMFYYKDIPIHFIKIDTEGWEYYILKGGENTIKKYKPIIQIEWHPINMKQCGVNENNLKNIMEEYGYYERSIADQEKLFFPR